eukprot:TRINITY_DN542_c0_g1_i4.p1 TRINITY_DN542_c0_g1~~TRINITY_DN542_c0_g1_i4.p1  ORF type:complete len:1450 (+),score=311.88 TRINITY_DN542_c0_g1_i4:280-4629(+)
MSFFRRAEGGLSVNRPLDAGNMGPKAQMAERSLSYDRPLDAVLSAAPPPPPPVSNTGMMQQVAPSRVAYTRPLGAVSGAPSAPPPQMAQMRASSIAYTRPLDAATAVPAAPTPLVQPAAPSISYTRPLGALTNVALPQRAYQKPLDAQGAPVVATQIAAAGRPYQKPLDAIEVVSNYAPSARAYQKPLDAADDSDYWTDLGHALNGDGASGNQTGLPPVVLAVSSSSQYLFGSQYMPEKSLLTPDEIDAELKNLRDLLDAGFLQAFQYEERKADLIKQKKFAFSSSIPHVSFGELSANVILDSMDDAPHTSSKAANRNVRVFISSTFRDMGDEREALLKHVFPLLQKEYRERGVSLTAVDLRWGITSEQTNNAQTINVCLSEIDRCRPYFVTLLGGRYGWAQPDHGVDELLKRTHDRAAESFPWIRKFSTRSVTELEIRHALLNDMGSETSRRGLVYMRKDAQDEDTRLTHLKKELQDARSQGAFRALGQYRDAEELKRTLSADLMKLLDEDFPAATVPTPLERERQAHDAFQDSRCRVYVSKPSYFSELNSHLLNPTSGPIVVVGDAGVGKSAFLCNWAVRYKRDNPDKLVITHFIGATSASTDLAQTLTRIMQEINSFYQLDKEIPTSVTAMVEKFPEFLAEAGKRRGLVLLLDALDQLSPADGAQDLLWLPTISPDGVRLVLSCQTSPCLNVITKRKWRSMQIQPLSKAERTILISEYMQQAGKKLTPEQTELVASSNQCGYPLFLRTLLEELRVFGSFEQLESKISGYLAAKTIPDLFDKVFERLEKDFVLPANSTNCKEVEKSFIGAVLGLVLVSRKGLAESEMLECLNLTQAYWSPLFLALEEFLVSRSGFLAFFHDYMRQAVEKRYSRIPNFFNDLRRLLTGYWNSKAASEMAAVRSSKDKLSPLAQRAFEEVPFHYEASSDINSLRNFISKPSHFRALAAQAFRFDLVRYVRSCDGAVAIKNAMQSLSDISDMDTTASFFKELGSYEIAEDFYQKALVAAEKVNPRNEVTLADVLDGLGYVQRLRGKYIDAAKTLERCLELKRRLLKEDDGSLATSINNLAIVFRKQGKYERAEELYNNALAIRLKIFGTTHADVAQSYNSLGCLYQDQGKFEIAEKNLMEAIRLRELLLGSGHPDLAMSLFNLGNVYLDWSRFQESVPLYDRALEIYEACFGPQHPYVAQVLNSMAGVQQEMGHYDDAEKIYFRTLQIREASLGSSHPDVALTLNDIAVLYSRQNRFDEAVVYYKRALEIRRAVVGEAHPDYAQALKNLATVYQDLGRYHEALPLFEKTLDVYKTALGELHPNVASACTGLAGLKQQMGRFNECIPLYEKALQIYGDLAGGAPDSDMALTLNDFAVLFFKMQNWAKAEETYLRALDMYERCFGEKHPDVCQALINIGHFHVSRGDKGKAKEYFTRAAETYREIFGANHAKTLHAISLTSA